jgi:hypothetical protein
VYSTYRIKAAAATLMAGFLLAIAFAGPAQAGNGTPKGWTAQQLKALQARSGAWNRFYNLGPDSPTAQELKAVRARSDAWNRYYHLGVYSRAVAAADKRRGEAMNQYYRVGRYAAIGEASGFVWTDAGIGAGAMLGLLMVAGGLMVAIRRRAAGKPSVPSTT